MSHLNATCHVQIEGIRKHENENTIFSYNLKIVLP